MKKRVSIAAIVILILAVFLSRSYVQHCWAVYRLQDKGIDMTRLNMANPVTGFLWLRRAAEKIGITAGKAGTDEEYQHDWEASQYIRGACMQDPDVLELLLKTRYSVNIKLSDGTTALHCVAAAGLLKQAQMLLDHGADISARTVEAHNPNSMHKGYALAPIHLAGAHHKMEVIKLFLARGANIDEPSVAGTPFSLAMDSSWRGVGPSNDDLLPVYHAFLELGARIDTTDKYGNTPIHFAMKNQQRPLIESVMETPGFDPNVANKEGVTPFAIVGSGFQVRSGRAFLDVTSSRDLIERLLAKGAKVSMLGTSIQEAAHHPDVFALLLKHGADPFVATKYGVSIWNGLEYAPSSEIISLADTLPGLRAPTSPDGKTSSGPLHVFSRASRQDLVEYFLRRGVSPNDRNDNGETALLMALEFSGKKDLSVTYRKQEIVRELLAAGVDVNARNVAGESALMKASRHDPAITRMLIAKGADVNAVAKPSRGKQLHVLDYYADANNRIGFDLLVKAGASKATILAGDDTSPDATESRDRLSSRHRYSRRDRRAGRSTSDQP